MSGTEIRRFTDDKSLFGGRWIVALLQAFSTSLATGLALPVVVIAAYVALTTSSLYRIAIIPLLAFGLWNLGALVAGRVCRERVRLLPWAFAGSVARAAAMAAMAYIAYHANPAGNDRMGAFLIALGVFGFGSGFGSVPVEALLQKSFESSSRAQLFLGRAFWGIIAALLSGVVVRSVFQNDGLATQRAFAYLFMAAAGCLASGAFFTLLIKEPVSRLSSARHGNATAPFRALSDRAMRRYLFFRVALSAVAMLDVFIIVYAMRELTFDRAFLGIYVIAFCTGLAICLPLSRSLTTRRGGRATLQTAVWLKLIAPLLMLTIPYLQESADVAKHVTTDRFYLWMIAACFTALGASLAFQGTGNFQYLSEIAPAVERARYFSTANIALMFATLFPLVGAWILEGWDFQRLFAVSAAAALIAVLLSGILVDNRIVASRPAASSHLSRATFR